MPSVYVKTLGCKVNSYDSDALLHRFSESGFTLQAVPQHADVTVVNTCSVTANADREARYLARRIKRENPQAFIVFTGCYAQTGSAALLDCPDVDLVIPNQVKNDLVPLVEDAFAAKTRGEEPLRFPPDLKPVRDNKQGHFKSSAVLFGPTKTERTRAFLKIQDGCDGFCTYCLIPYARGTSQSVAPHLVLEECRRLVAEGVREIVFTGIHIGDYGRENQPEGDTSAPIADLLATILSEHQHSDLRIRISSLEPSEVTEPLLAMFATYRDQICPHFHLPLQSGDDEILRRMRRTYTTAAYRDTVLRLREIFPEASIGADIIPGFPAETNEHFQNTLAFIRSCELSYLHVFPYSRRPHTAAARMPDHLDGALIKERAAQLRSLSTELEHTYQTTCLGRVHEVLWLSDVDAKGRRKGLTPNYLQVVSSTPVEAGNLERRKLVGFVAQGIFLATPLSDVDFTAQKVIPSPV